MTRVRDLAKILGLTEGANPTNAVLTSTADGSGLVVYATLDDLPSSGLTSGDQAFVSSTNRFYISNGSGWYNVALVNATPALTIDPTGTIVLATDGSTPTVITLTATDSDNPVAGLAYTVESDGNFGGLATISQDSSVFTITPLSEDSATATSATLTFKASDGISFGSGTRTLTLSFKVQYSNYTTMLVKADTAGTDNQVDASTNAHTITEAGNTVSTAFTPYHPGRYSTYFDGTANGEIKTTSKVASLALSSSDNFTIEGYFNLQSLPTGASQYRVLVSCRDASYNGPAIYIDESPTKVKVLAAGGSIQLTSSSSISENTWYHIALVNEAGNTMTLYINGVSEGTYSYADTPGNSDVGIMGNIDTSTQNQTGYVRDLRIVDGTAVYTSAFTPPIAPLTAITNTVFLSCNTPYIRDNSSDDNALTLGSGVSTKRFGPYDYLGYAKADHGGSVYFDGSGDYLSTTHDTTLKVASEDFTYECWWYPTASQTNRQIAGDFVVTSYPSNCSGWDLTVASDGTLYARWGSPSYQDFGTSTPPIYNTWNHVVFTRNSSTIAIFLNGNRIGSDTSSITFSASTSANFYVGWAGSQSGTTFNPIEGYVTDARLVKGTAIYDPDSTTLTVPTAPLSAVTNTQLLTATNKNDIWDGSAGLKLVPSGDADVVNTQRKFTTSSAIYMDGSGDYWTIASTDPNINNLNFGTSDFTIECWTYNTTNGNNYPTFLGSITGWSAGASGHRFDNTGYANKFWFGLNGSSGRSSGDPFMHSTNNFNHDQWYHYAITREGNTWRMFIDGTLEDTQTYTGSFNQGLGGARIGFSTWDGANGYYSGYVQDMRITKGLARYTTSFTPPTAEFEG